MEPRLASGIWVQAHMRRLAMMGIPSFVVARGDPVAGAVLVKVNRLDGHAALYQRMNTLDGSPGWVKMLEGEDRRIEAAIARQCERDRDLWVIEIEDREGRHFLDEGAGFGGGG